jgi:hypothetical protein
LWRQVSQSKNGSCWKGTFIPVKKPVFIEIGDLFFLDRNGHIAVSALPYFRAISWFYPSFDLLAKAKKFIMHKYTMIDEFTCKKSHSWEYLILRAFPPLGE